MFIVYDEKMNIKPFPKGALPLDIFISSIQRNRTTDNVEGAAGIIDHGYTNQTRNISVDVGLLSHDTRDYRLLRDATFSFFNENDYMYISEEYEKGKRYKVATATSFIPERLTRNMAQASFGLEMVDLPYAESIGTTADIDKNGIDANSELWGFGMGLIADDDSLKYTHTGTSFKIYNAGNVPIHPFEQELKITISNVAGSSSYLELTNTTTGDTFRVNEGVPNDKTVILDGPNITNNGLQYLRKTNRKFITLKHGWNNFIIKGASSAKVAFDFRFYYL